jgi:hypothetical protein
MKLADHFDVLLSGTVNLPSWKLTKLDERVEAIYAALCADDVLGPLVLDNVPQGSWAHRTIINPKIGKEFDADFLLHMEENPDWSDSPGKYIEAVYAALGRNSTYKQMPRNRKCRCVRVTYADFCHVDIVPYVKLGGWREVIVNKDEDVWEDTNPTGFTQWMRDKDEIADGNLRKVIRLLKYLRDQSDWTGTKSVILTTLVGERVSQVKKLVDTGYYNSVPTALLHVVQDLDDWLDAFPSRPSVADPSRSGATFDHRWDDATYLRFRERINGYRAKIEAAYDAADKESSVRLWQDIFGAGFKAPATVSSSDRFGTVTAGESTGRSGRSG